MSSLTLQDFLDQKRLPAHLMIVIISLIVVGIFSVVTGFKDFPEDQVRIFFLIILQIEIFIFLGYRFFTGMKKASDRKELTKIVLSRFSVFLLVCFAIALLVVILFIWFINLYYGTNSIQAIFSFMKYGFSGWLKGTVIGLLFGAAIFIFLQWQDALSREQKLREQNLIFQNETLKNQVNPHFLFNSLNTLSSLVSTEPEIADKFINSLASIYRYILENSSKDLVPLEDEILFIRDYFYLHKIRDDGKIELEIKVNENDKFLILPISLQGLVENAIKHNKATRENPLKIGIFTDGQQIIIKNNLQKMATQVRSTGIGLKNLAERVRLITGKELVVDESMDYFTVRLPLLV